LHRHTQVAAVFRRLVRTHPLFFFLVLAVLVVEAAARIQGGPGPSVAAFRNPFAAIAIASIFCRYVLYDRQGPTRRWIVYLSPLAFVAAFALEGSDAPPTLQMLDAMVGLGILGACGFIVAARASADPARRTQFVGQLLDALVLPMSASMASFGLWSVSRINPVYDGRIYAFEEILGGHLSVLCVKAYSLFPALGNLASGCYAMIGLGLAIVAALQESEERERDVLTAAVVAGGAGFALYFLCPVVGPHSSSALVHPNGKLPLGLDAALLTLTAVTPRNGMPSLHTVWALLVWFNLAPLSTAVRRGLQLFVLMTLWALMGLNEHWFLDVVVAVPLAVAIQAACVGQRTIARRTALMTATTVTTCLVMTMGWLVAIRIGAPALNMPAALAWAAVIATIGWPMFRLRAMRSRSDSLEMNVLKAHEIAVVR
jgi:hypothetical protein